MVISVRMRRMKKIHIYSHIPLSSVVGGGQTIGQLDDGKKIFVWGGLPDEIVSARTTKRKKSYEEAMVIEVEKPSTERVEPRDPESYLSTSPWQIMNFEAEQRYKAALIEEAFELHNIVLPEPIDVYTDGVEYEYRNKVEFSWFGDTPEDGSPDTLDLAFFRRGSKGKIVIDGTSLVKPEINKLGRAIRDLLRTKLDITARNLKTLLIRSDQKGNCVWQLYVKDKLPEIISTEEAAALPAQGGEVIYSDPRSPASRITERLTSFGELVLSDEILGVKFNYATEGFFQVNLPVYEQSLKDMKKYIEQAGPTSFSEGSAFPAELDQDNSNLRSSVPEENEGQDGEANHKSSKVLDLYAGVGSIGLTIGGNAPTLVEISEHAVREMRRNIEQQGSQAKAVLAPSEKALENITGQEIVIVDPPRAGLHTDVIETLLEKLPPRIVYLSCNPVTQARDVELLCKDQKYGIKTHRGYNFFPRTPHIENLVVLDKI